MASPDKTESVNNFDRKLQEVGTDPDLKPVTESPLVYKPASKAPTGFNGRFDGSAKSFEQIPELEPEPYNWLVTTPSVVTAPVTPNQYVEAQVRERLKREKGTAEEIDAKWEAWAAGDEFDEAVQYVTDHWDERQ